MLHVALTGNVAAGKSAVAELFRRSGATIIDADELARATQQPGTPVFEAIVRRFGREVVAPDGTLERPALRAVVLADPAALADLNAIVHPEVHRRRAALLAEARARDDQVVVSVIPLLFEAADPGEFDTIVLVDAPVAVRHDRLTSRRGLTAEEASRMIAAQAPAEPKRVRSDYIIDNDGDLEMLERRAAEVWAEIRTLGSRGGA